MLVSKSNFQRNVESGGGQHDVDRSSATKVIQKTTNLKPPYMMYVCVGLDLN